MWNTFKRSLLLKFLPWLPSYPISARYRIARTYLKGRGIEIGALHNPLPLPRQAQVTYVDRMNVADLKKHYAEFRNLTLAPVAILSNGETLNGISDQSQDFVIGNHLIEHAQDPIRMLDNWLRVLRPGGVIFLTLPDKRFTFDRDRSSTSVDHLIRDHQEGPTSSRRYHYREWVEQVAHTPPDQAGSSIDQLDESDYSIHFHAWDTPGFIEFLLYCQSRGQLPFEIEMMCRNGNETIFILRKLHAY